MENRVKEKEIKMANGKRTIHRKTTICLPKVQFDQSKIDVANILNWYLKIHFKFHGKYILFQMLFASSALCSLHFLFYAILKYIAFYLKTVIFYWYLLPSGCIYISIFFFSFFLSLFQRKWFDSITKWAKVHSFEFVFKNKRRNENRYMPRFTMVRRFEFFFFHFIFRLHHK